MRTRAINAAVTVHMGTGEDRLGNPIDPDAQDVIWGLLLRKMVETFGGGSLTRQEGGWLHPSGRMIMEAGVTLVSYPNPHEARVDLDLLARSLLVIGRQEALILVTETFAREFSVADEDRT
jgi:hypothetical protein